MVISFALLVGVLNFLSPPTFAAESTIVPFLLPCEGNESRCIESLVATKADGTKIKAQPTGRIINQSLGNTDPYFKYIQGQSVEWEFPGLTFQNGSGRAFLRSYYWPASNLHCWSDGNCSSNEEEWGTYMVPSDLSGSRPLVNLSQQDAQVICPSNPSGCTLGSPPWEFGIDISFTLTVRMAPDFVPLYTQGRVKNFQLTQLNSKNSSYHEFAISFTPLKLQNVAYQLSDPSQIDHSLYETDQGVIWVYGMNNSKVRSLGNCGSVGGLVVSSNAYFMWNPVWNSENSSLDVRLQSTHRDLNGELSKGYLEVKVPLDMAKCLWGVDIAGNVTAKFSLIYPDQSSPDVISISSKVSQGNYEMVAAGFHFSSPTVQVKLLNNPSGELPVAAHSPTPSLIPVIAKAPIRKSSIRCVKGKTVRTITGFTPYCPVGFSLRR